ncbi:MAG TPA: hypothetical protein VFR94_00685 [Nitrososphaeraceae archaeon]|nr:hypothetical protein [Nitrososphaeraceae archaeon]
MTSSLEEERKANANAHVDKESKIASKTYTPPNIRGSVFTSTSQKKRYITIPGIESDTSYQEFQWPMFAVKELSDNAVDFLKENYSNATANERKIATSVKLDTVVKPKMLRIAVRNSNVDNSPVFQNLDGIFDYDNWVSTKRNQHRMTAGGLGDFLKRALGMGYASWTGHNDNPKDSFEEEQWKEPVILRFNRKEYKVFLIVNNDNPLTRKEGPIITGIGSDTEVEVALPLTASYWDTAHSSFLDDLERYYKTFKLPKRNLNFSFTREVI